MRNADVRTRMEPIAPDTPDQAVGRFQCIAGTLIRGQVRRRIKLAAAMYDLQLELDEDRGWFDSLFVCRVRGRAERVQQFAELMQRYFKQLREDI